MSTSDWPLFSFLCHHTNQECRSAQKRAETCSISRRCNNDKARRGGEEGMNEILIGEAEIMMQMTQTGRDCRVPSRLVDCRVQYRTGGTFTNWY